MLSTLLLATMISLGPSVSICQQPLLEVSIRDDGAHYLVSCRSASTNVHVPTVPDSHYPETLPPRLATATFTVQTSGEHRGLLTHWVKSPRCSPLVWTVNVAVASLGGSVSG